MRASITAGTCPPITLVATSTLQRAIETGDVIAACLNDTSSKDAAAGGGNGGAAIGTGPGSSIHEPTTTVAAREAVYNLREMEYGTLEGATIAGEVTAEIRKISKRWRDGEVDLKVGGVKWT